MRPVDEPAEGRTRTPAQHQRRESRFLLLSIGGIVTSASLLRVTTVRLIGMKAIPAGMLAWAIAVGIFGYLVARRREGASPGEAVVIAAAMGAIGAIAGFATSLI